MKLNRAVFILVFYLFANLVLAQRTEVYTNKQSGFQTALTLYGDQRYSIAFQLFEDQLHISDDVNMQSMCCFYMASAALKMNHPKAVSFAHVFLRDFPTSAFKTSIYQQLGDYFFERRQYDKTLEWYEKISLDRVGKEKKTQFQFRKGFALFKIGQYNDAQDFLEPLANDTVFGNWASYYLGMIAYEKNRYREARQMFANISDNDTLSSNLSYYKAFMSFKSGEYQQAIDQASEQMFKKNTATEVLQLNKILGESYIKLKAYKKAIPHLLECRSKFNEYDKYQLAFCYFKDEAYEKAVSYFEEVKDKTDVELYQNAMFHLGESLLNLDKKVEALKKFSIASECEGGASQIKEEAAVFEAKLSYDIGNPYKNPIKVLQDFITQYPNSVYVGEVESNLVSLYISNHNYDKALALLSDDFSFESKRVTQMVTYRKAKTFFQEKEYLEALEIFKQSITQAIDDKITLKSLFYEAQSHLILEHYKEALSGFKSIAFHHSAHLIDESQVLDYYIGLTYMLLEDYDRSIKAFGSFLEKSNDAKMKEEASLKMANTFLRKKAYTRAYNYYVKVISFEGRYKEQALFMKSICLGMMNKHVEKINHLEEILVLYPNSRNISGITFELANTYAKIGDAPKALVLYESIKEKYPTSDFYSKSLLLQGRLYTKEGDTLLGMKNYKTIVNDFPNTKEAINAIASSKAIYLKQNRLDEYVQWVNSIDLISDEALKKEKDLFSRAKQDLLKSQDDTLFLFYIENYPKGFYLLETYYLMGEYYIPTDSDKAKSYFEVILTHGQSRFYEPSLYQLSKLLLKEKKFKVAEGILREIEEKSTFNQRVWYAQQQLSELYFKTKKYKEAMVYLKKIIDNPNADDKGIQKAYLYKLRIEMHQKNYKQAEASLTSITENHQPEILAEIQYYKAKIENINRLYEQSNKTVLTITKTYPTQDHIVAKALLIMAKNFIVLEDTLQARFVLDNIAHNYSKFTTEAEASLKLKKELLSD